MYKVGKNGQLIQAIKGCNAQQAEHIFSIMQITKVDGDHQCYNKVAFNNQQPIVEPTLRKIPSPIEKCLNPKGPKVMQSQSTTQQWSDYGNVNN